MKAVMLEYSKTPEAIGVMQQIRRLFDPRGILMPSKYLPMESALPFEQEKKEHVGAEQ